ncbi:hypothetical protein [Chryseobacterium taiwanense]|uniref:Uncharacterized protein n=1 Tax=Chryseobacterium taiwanense TaxID=363331 RepID=A0A0B4DCC8_9FLAO|nr:hypothetical protein [Chryseobacterium taiwanense]KIC64331.1 hypothetical protein RM51_06380 [Chryseobacterium taiwanense]
MKYLPFEHLIYTTNLSEQNVIRILSENVGAKRKPFTSNNGSTKEYEGTITENNFEINRIIKNRNSFLPQITGTIQENTYETQIEVKMKLHRLVSIFMIFWCTFVIFFLIITLIKSKGIISNDLVFPLCMLLFAYLLTMLGFKMESKRSKKDLEKMFEAKVIKE